MDYEKKIQSLTDSFGDWWNSNYEIPQMTNKLYPYKEMFSPIKINNITIKNRLVMAPMGNISMCEETGRPSDKMLSYFEERAKGGVGLITTGLIPVSFGIDKSLIELGDLTYFPRIDRSRTVLMGWRNLAAKCHAHGSRLFIQLTPGLGRVGNPQCLITQKSFPRSASINPNWYMKDVPCLRLSDSSCKKIIKNMGQSAADSKVCNIDGVYLHGHEGYLLEQMSNPAFNHRKIGRYANWKNFGLDMVKQIRKRVGDNFPIMYRIDLTLALNATYKDRMDTQSPLKKFKNERTVEDCLEYMKELVKAGVDMFDVDMGCYDNWWLPHPPSSMPSACFLDLSSIVKKYFQDNKILSNKGLPVPVVGVGKLGYPDIAEKALRDKKCDMVMLGRPLLADPDWCNKAYKGDTQNIIPCIGCQEACINEFVQGGHPQCAVNPRTAFENEYPKEIPKAQKLKKIAVIGGGPAGIVACQVLLKRGHEVDLYEKSKQLGGNIVPGCKPIIKYEIKNYLQYLNTLVKDMEKNQNFNLLLATEANTKLLKQKGYDTILVATGSKPCVPKIEGIKNKNVVSAIDVLNNNDLVKDAKDIVVIGGGFVGAEIAYLLRYELDKNVKVVEMQKYIMNHVCTANRGHLIHYLERGGVELINCAVVNEIKPNAVLISQNKHKNVPNPYNTWAPILPENIENPMDKLKKIKDKYEDRELKADIVILATGSIKEDSLFFECLKDRTASEVYNIGDSFNVGLVFDAVKTAYKKALSI